MVFRHDLLSRGRLRIIEPVFDDLEDNIVRGKSKYDHNHPFFPPRYFEPIIGSIQVMEQISVEFRLSMLVVADRDVELCNTLEWHDRFQELYQFMRPLYFNVEIGTREA